MKPSIVLKKLFTVACVYYAIFSLALLLINAILAGGTDGMLIGVLNVLMLFPFSFSLSGADFLKGNDKMSGASKRLLHYLIFAAAFLLFLWLPSNMAKNLTNGIFMFALFSLVYWLVYLIYRLTAKRIRNIKEE